MDSKFWKIVFCFFYIIFYIEGKTFSKTILALCTQWTNNICPIATPNAIQDLFDASTQTLCKAEIMMSAQQIDWQSSNGKGELTSAKINNVELLVTPIIPSTAYLVPIYPKCEDWYSCFPPYGNVVPGTGPRISILELAQSNLLEFSAHVEWHGNHSTITPSVCSMNGVSYSAVIRLDLEYDVEDNSECPGWNASINQVCNGRGKCLCSTIESSTRKCICNEGFGHDDCSECSSTNYGISCHKKCEPCLNNGICNSGFQGDGSCICKEGFDPSTRCATCLPLHYGPQCKPCPSCNYPRGNCVDGINGNGKCACAVGWDIQKNCADCMKNYYGMNCTPCQNCGNGKCLDGLQGNGECKCPPGFDPKQKCQECLPNHYGKNCTLCDSCNLHGTCQDGLKGDGTCTCDLGYTKESRCRHCAIGWDFDVRTNQCECSPEHFGPYCLSCPICAPHGRCNAGRDGDGNCICDVGWSASDNCVGCMNGYYGFNCQPCHSCGNGKCDDGLKGNGLCICHTGWNSSTNCFDCLEGYYGENCSKCPYDCGLGKCSSGIKGSGKCECKKGWENLGNIQCAKCSKGYFGSSCLQCPGTLSDGIPCNGHGECQERGPNAVECVCKPRYSGISCETYEFPITLVIFGGLLALIVAFICMYGIRRLSGRKLPPQRTNKRSTFKGVFSNYVEISDMNDLELFVSADSKDWLIPFEALTLQYEVGNGTSGQVFRSLYHSGGGSSTVAVKRLYSPITGQEYFQNFFRREVAILSKLHHPNVVRFYGVSYYARVLYIVTDFCPASLNDLIATPHAKGPFEESFFIKIIQQITSGMGFLHSRSVVHRDLKPANVLLTDTEDVNICDFGLSRHLDSDATSMTAEVGTPSYMAPEMATMGAIQCSTKGDVYSFGILLYSAWTRSKPYGDQGMNPFQLMTAVVNGLRPVIPINCPQGLSNLMRACWDANPASRPSFAEISLIIKDANLLTILESIEQVNSNVSKSEYLQHKEVTRYRRTSKSSISTPTSSHNPSTTVYGSVDSIDPRENQERTFSTTNSSCYQDHQRDTSTESTPLMSKNSNQPS